MPLLLSVVSGILQSIFQGKADRGNSSFVSLSDCDVGSGLYKRRESSLRRDSPPPPLVEADAPRSESFSVFRFGGSSINPLTWLLPQSPTPTYTVELNDTLVMDATLRLNRHVDMNIEKLMKIQFCWKAREKVRLVELVEYSNCAIRFELPPTSIRTTGKMTITTSTSKTFVPFS